MSEYQYYEFQAIDRPLTEEEQRAVSRLSSRVNPHPRQAIFVYNWSSLPANPKQVLASYYDAMYYVANWGTTRLMFRFPQSLIDTRQIEPYCLDDYISCESSGDYVILEMKQWDEEGYYDWIEGEGTLDGLLPLRDDILQQDYRALYLAWLSAIDSSEVSDDTVEPPVPPGLKKLTPALRRFVEAFHLDEALVNAAAKTSPDRAPASPSNLRQRIAALPRETCDEWLLRLAQGEEPHLSLAFRHYLEPSRAIRQSTQKRRTVGELVTLAEAEKDQLRQQAAAKAEARRIRELEALAPKAEETWTFARQLLEQGYSHYDEVVELLVKLHDLAIHQGTEEAFETRLREIRATYPRRKGLLVRLDEAGLP
ncbi:MAG: hypothetical protein RRC07_09940 [Anaerolineae bacterium]|nr:hypothetical protein [Anaerolineae bacterium]